MKRIVRCDLCAWKGKSLKLHKTMKHPGETIAEPRTIVVNPYLRLSGTQLIEKLEQASETAKGIVKEITRRYL